MPELPRVTVKNVKLVFNSFTLAEFTVRIDWAEFKVTKANKAFEFPVGFNIEGRFKSHVIDQLQKAYTNECKSQMEAVI